MFWPDVIDLRSFYETRLGSIACQVIRRRIETFWDECSGDYVIGIGYALPYLLPFLEEARFLAAFMPATQGVIHWPGSHRPNLSVLVEEDELPLEDNSVTRILAVHALEHTDNIGGMIGECWRVLEPGGRLLCIVPNRRGVWARTDNTPFGQGQPYSTRQLRQLLEQYQFTQTRSESSLFIPPMDFAPFLKTHKLLEECGDMMFGMFGGVVLTEAEKQLYAPRPRGKLARERTRIMMPEPRPALGMR